MKYLLKKRFFITKLSLKKNAQFNIRNLKRYKNSNKAYINLIINELLSILDKLIDKKNFPLGLKKKNTFYLIK